MTNKPLWALGSAVALIAVSLITYLLQPDPSPDSQSDAAASRASLNRPSSGAEDHPSDPGNQQTASDLAETLRQKYAESEIRRQREIEEEQQPQFVAPPIALLEVNAAMGLDSTQVKVVEDLRKSFVDGLTKLGKDPSSPEYLAHWKKERQRVDDTLQQQLGDDLFNTLGSMTLGAIESLRKEASR